MIRFLVFIFICVGLKAAAQKTAEDIKVENAQYCNIRIIAASDDQRYALVHKTYQINKDTILVFDRKSPTNPVDTILKKSNAFFLNSEAILISGADNAELINLKNGKRVHYGNNRRTAVLSNSKQFILENAERKIKIYDLKGNTLKMETNVIKWVSDRKDKLYGIRIEKDKYEIFGWDGKKIKIIFLTVNEISNIEILPSGKFVVITEKKIGKNHNSVSIALIRSVDGQIFQNSGVTSSKTDRVNIKEITKGNGFLIDFQQTERPVEDKMLDIWYEGDKTLRDKKTGKATHDFFVWNISNNSIFSLPSDLYDNYIGINNSDELLAFHSDEKFSYTGDEREFDIYRYKAKSKDVRRIFERIGNLVMSANGRFTLGFSATKKTWTLYDHKTEKSEALALGVKSSNPIFTYDGKIIFETDGALLQYDLNSGTSGLIDIAQGEKVMFHKFESQLINQFGPLTASIRQLKADQSLFLKVSRYRENDQGYFGFTNNKTELIIPYTGSRVRDFTYHSRSKFFFSVEENFNQPFVLKERSVNSENSIYLYRSNPQDTSVLRFRRHIFHYKNSLGKPLKGVLYYPIRFDPQKQYPLVVHIYGILSTNADKFISPELGDNGFTKRLLLESEYFVFEPDIINDHRGPGVSALDCVNTGLDAIGDYHNIDPKRIGLIGHSMGGYETNFISTQSNRFAAYVSGASIGEITSSYFAFNELFKIADYSRFESGQLAMNVSFVENKKLYFGNNPINYVENVNAPVLLWAGKKDANVPVSQTMNFFMGLLRNNKNSIALLYNSQKHSMERSSHEIIDLNNKVLDWWNYFLKDRKDIPWINKQMKGD